jgi:hypothetical protein
MANAPVKNIKSVNRWTPNPAPVNNENLSDYLFSELNRLSDIIFNLDVMRLEQTNRNPEDTTINSNRGKPRDGDIRYADGTNWNPGGGIGIYAYIGGSWTKL